MIKKRYVKKIYIEEAYCDKCGSIMKPTGVVYSTFPEQYPYKCTNTNCDGHACFFSYECPGKLKYEFEDESENLSNDSIQNLTDDFVQKLKKIPTFIHTVDTAIIEDIQYV